MAERSNGWFSRAHSARRAHAEGTALLRFRMDRSGKVLSYARARSAGFDMLDEEVLAMIRRAQPLPALSPVALKAVANENDLH
ncbi:MAG TPA: energy transducer TonB [Dongiaceae bacterium]|nr:energy transducer TonB [Dongiaceae bacterium]